MKRVEQPSAPNGAFSRFFENPKVRVVERVLAVLSIPLGVYLTISTQQYRRLDYMINPTKAIVVKSGKLSSLSISYNGQEIKTDVTAVQIAFWNAGNQSIKSVDILKPLVFKTSNTIPILEAQIRKRSRDVTGIILDQSKINIGELTIKWDILENNDGGVIQLMVAGDTETLINTDGIIEGKKALRMRNNPPSKTLIIIFGGAYILAWALSVILPILNRRQYISLNYQFLKRFEQVPQLVIFIGAIVMALEAWLFKIPPFGW